MIVGCGKDDDVCASGRGLLTASPPGGLATYRAVMTTLPAGRRSLRTLGRRHPGVRQADQLTLGERAADRMRNGMGSWTFVFAALLFLAGWMIGNGGSGFDPYPFILLNLILSCLAAMQGAILLIAARRADQISAELAAHDYAADTDSEQLIGEVRALVRCIQRQVGAPDPTDDDFAPATQRVRQALNDSGTVQTTAG